MKDKKEKLVVDGVDSEGKSVTESIAMDIPVKKLIPELIGDGTKKIKRDSDTNSVYEYRKSQLRAIHITLKQIASNTENVTTAEMAKVAAADLQGVIEGMFGGEQ